MNSRDLFIQEFKFSDDDIELHKLAERYHRETEFFDRQVCTHFTPDGIAVPVTREQYGAISRNARKVLAVILLEYEGRFSRKQIFRAISSAPSAQHGRH